MNLSEFIIHMKGVISSHVGSSATIQEKEIYKNNDKRYTGLVICDGKNIAPTIYMEPYYHRYLDGVSLKDIEDDFISTYEEHKPKESIDLSFFTDFEKVKNKITYKLVNQERNHILLQDIPYRSFLDLAIVYQLILDSTAENFASILIRKEHIKQWEIDENDLYELAIKNTPRILPVSLKPMSFYLEGLDSIGECSSRPEMLVCTNTSRLHGASCILYPDELNKIASYYNSDFYMIPSSIHETIFIPSEIGKENISREYLDSLVKDVNDNEVIDEEVLSDHVYLYLYRENKLVS